MAKLDPHRDGLTGHDLVKYDLRDPADQKLLKRAFESWGDQTEKLLVRADAWALAVLEKLGTPYAKELPIPKPETLAWYAWCVHEDVAHTRDLITRGDAKFAALEAFQVGFRYGVGQFKELHERQALQHIQRVDGIRQGASDNNAARAAAAKAGHADWQQRAEAKWRANPHANATSVAKWIEKDLLNEGRRAVWNTIRRKIKRP